MTEPQVIAGLEADADEWENDSAIGRESDTASSTASIASSIMKHREENGRTYHAYKVPIIYICESLPTWRVLFVVTYLRAFY
jgi:hypothetical protein